MAAARPPHQQTFEEFYASGVPKRDPTMRRRRLTGSEEDILLWLYWRGDHIAAIARQMGLGNTTVLERIHELHYCPSTIRSARFCVITEPRAAPGRRKSWAFFCRLCGYRGEGPRQAALQHAVNHFFSGVRAADLNGNKVIDYRYHKRAERVEREGWQAYREEVRNRRGFFRRLLGS